MFKQKRIISRFTSFVVAAALFVPLFFGVGSAVLRSSTARADGLPAESESASAVSSSELVTTNPTYAPAAAAAAPQSTISEINLSSNVTSAPVGVLEPFSMAISTANAHIEMYGVNTVWVKWTAAYGKWGGFGNDTPCAINDGSTRYGIQVRVYLNSGYAFSDKPTIYYNGKNITSNTYTDFRKNDARSAIVTIDMGKATGSGSPVLRTVTFDTNGGSEIKACKIVDGYAVMKPVAPTKGDMIFCGWFTDTELLSRYDFNTPVTKNITLYAKWGKYPIDISLIKLKGNIVSVEPGKLPNFTITSLTDNVKLSPYDIRHTWIKWSGYGEQWKPVDYYNLDLTAVDDGVTHYGVRLYVEIPDGYCLSEYCDIRYEDPTGVTRKVSARINTKPEGYVGKGFDYICIDFGLAKAPAPVVFDFYNGTDELSAAQLDALEFLKDRRLIDWERQKDGSIEYDVNEGWDDFTVWTQTGKMELCRTPMQGTYEIDSSKLQGTQFTSITFKFPFRTGVYLYNGAISPDAETCDMLTYLASSDVVNSRTQEGSIIQYDLDKDGCYDMQWNKTQNFLMTIYSNSIRNKWIPSDSLLKGSKFTYIEIWLRKPVYIDMSYGPESLDGLQKRALAYLSENDLIQTQILGEHTVYDLDHDGNFDVSVNAANQMKILENNTNLSGVYTIDQGLAMDCCADSVTFIFSRDYVLDFTSGPIDASYAHFSEAISRLCQCHLCTERLVDGVVYYDLDKDGTDDLKRVRATNMLEVIPTGSAEGRYYFNESQLYDSNWPDREYIKSITLLLPTRLSSVSLSVKAPASGTAPSFSVTLPSDAKFVTSTSAFADVTAATNGVIWTDLSAGGMRLSVSGPSFAANHRYEVAIALRASKGYLFKKDATVKINGYTATKVENNGDTLIAYLQFAALKPTPTPGPLSEKTIAVGQSYQYKVPGVSATAITWSVGNTAVATVSINGTVTGKSVGNTYLYAKLPDGSTVKCLIRVTYPTLKISYTEKTLHINQTFMFNTSGATGQKITWSVGNPNVAAVDASGKVTAKSVGNTYLYARSADGRSAKCLLKVIDPGKLSINYTEKTVYLGQTFTFAARNAGILKPTWSVGNTAIATVDATTGKVTPKSAGNTYLYVKTEDGRSARCLLRVVDPGPLSITYTEKTIKVGESFTFTAKNPAGQTVTWRVGNTTVATVTSTGAATASVTGKTVANTYLYASTPDGREVKCLIKVFA